MYQYLYPSLLFHNDELFLMIKLITINRIDIVINILSRIRNSKIVKLMLQHLVYHSTVRKQLYIVFISFCLLLILNDAFIILGNRSNR